jgi:zinc-binding alcohol dehydrogenase/oxidoreductase
MRVLLPPNFSTFGKRTNYPNFMKALVLKRKGQLPELSHHVSKPLEDGRSALVKIGAAALNHRDIWIISGHYPGINYPVVPGSDGAGWVGDEEVVIQPGINWGDSPEFQGPAYQILGLPANGTFAEYVLVEKKQVYIKPAHLSMEEAAALPLAGLTAYRVLFSRCKAKTGEKVLISGIGGGVASFCMQFALAAGLQVFVTSGSDEKIGKAKSAGAQGGVNYTRENWAREMKSLAGGFDLIIDSAGGGGFASLLKLCNSGGRIGIYGGSAGTITNISPQLLFWRQISILGSTMGTGENFEQMLNFVSRHEIHPIVDSVYPLERSDEAFRKMEKGSQFGKIVLRV